LSGLIEGPTYYVRAYATNSKGTGYGVQTTFKLCPSFTVTHIGGLNGAAVTKTVTYKSVSTALSGVARCWIGQNLGADQQATSSTDNTESSAGWYFQFNRSQGYQHDGSVRTPSPAWTTWNGSLYESSDWVATSDPCNSLLGIGWRIPTSTEWSMADGSPQNWNTAVDAYNSVLKLHMAGYLSYNVGALTSRGSTGIYWSSTQYNSSYSWYLTLSSGNSSMSYDYRSNGYPHFRHDGYHCSG